MGGALAAAGGEFDAATLQQLAPQLGVLRRRRIAPQPAAVALTASLQQVLPEVVDVEVPPGAQLVVDGSPLVDVLDGIEDQVPGLHVAAEVHDADRLQLGPEAQGLPPALRL